MDEPLASLDQEKNELLKYIIKIYENFLKYQSFMYHILQQKHF